jgi:hypothetical protein
VAYFHVLHSSHRRHRRHPNTSSHAAAQAQHEVQRALLLDVVVRQSATILQLLAREDETLLVRRNALLVLDLRFHVLDRVAALNLEGDRFARQRLDEDFACRRASAARGAVCSPSGCCSPPECGRPPVAWY